MKHKEQDRPRQRVPQRQKSNVPLTFYRSADSSGKDSSPFTGRPAKESISGLRKFIINFFEVILIVLMLALLVYSVIVRPSARIELNSQAYHPTDVYRQAADKYLKSLKNNNKITFSESGIIKSMQQQFPEISSVSVELPVFAQTPVIHITIAEPSFKLKNNGAAYIVGSNGVAVTSNQQLINEKNLPVVDDQSGFSAKAGQQVMSSSAVSFINTLVAQCKHANVPIGSLTLPPQAQELDLRTSDKPYFVKFYLGGDPLLQSGQFLATRHQFDAANTQPVQYLDVRVSGKIFYQ